jgi:hypothetical protein
MNRQSLIEKDKIEWELYINYLTKVTQELSKEYEDNISAINEFDDYNKAFHIGRFAYFIGYLKDPNQILLLEKFGIENSFFDNVLSIDEIEDTIKVLHDKYPYYIRINEIIPPLSLYSLVIYTRRAFLTLITDDDFELSEKEKEDFSLNKNLIKLINKSERRVNENVSRTSDENKHFDDISKAMETYLKEENDKIFEQYDVKGFSELQRRSLQKSPHRLIYIPLYEKLKKINQKLLGKKFNERSFLVCCYDLFKLLYLKEGKRSFMDKDLEYIEVEWNNNIEEYKYKTALSMFRKN